MSKHCTLCGLVMVLFVVGCGQRGPARHNLSGTVTFRGQPVPAAWIHFDPDTSQGNSGPSSSAKVENGRYKTFPDKGIFRGAYMVTVMATIPTDESSVVFVKR